MNAIRTVLLCGAVAGLGAGCAGGAGRLPPGTLPPGALQTLDSTGAVGHKKAKIIEIGTGFSTPYGIAVDAKGNVYVADTGNNAVKKIAPPFTSPTHGTITTIGQGLYDPYSVAVDAAENVYVAEAPENVVKKVAPSGKITKVGWGFKSPYGVAVDGSGNVYVADYSARKVKRVAPGGQITTVVSSIAYPQGVAVDVRCKSQCAVYVSSENGPVYMISSGYPLAIGSFDDPFGIATNASGNVYVADTQHNSVEKVTPSGTITAIGSGFKRPQGVAVDAKGDVFVADAGNSKVYEVLR
jgi:sugar lactone lactonase YvrE